MSLISVVAIPRLSGTLYRAALALCLAFALSAATCPDVSAAPRKAVSRTAKTAKKSLPVKAPVAPPIAVNPVEEWESINGEVIAFRNALAVNPDDDEAKQKLAELALRSARAAERALSRGDEDLFRAFAEQIEAGNSDIRDRLERMSGRGIGAADFALGTFALHGLLGQRDLGGACTHFSVALDKGFRGARFRVAQCLTEQAPERAAILMREAAESGHVAAMEHLGRTCLEASPPDAPCAYRELERAAREGRASARTLLAWMYAKGIGGRSDEARAARLYREAAAQGEMSARNNLGELLENGRGVNRDQTAAFEQYRQAAEAGYPPAQFNLGRLYAAGKGVEKDVAQARHWLGEAAKAGVDPAARILDLLERDARTTSD